jgi:uncharacterized protein (TIGR00297 family)
MVVGFLTGYFCRCSRLPIGTRKQFTSQRLSLLLVPGVGRLYSSRTKVNTNICTKNCFPALKRLSGSDTYKMSFYNPVLANFKWSFIVNSAIFSVLLFNNQRVLTRRGVIHAYVLGLLLWCCFGYAGWSTCVLFLVLGSLATKAGLHIKQAKGIAEKRGGARGPENVWGAAGSGAVCAILYGVLSPYGVAKLSLLQLAFVASLSSKLADTVSSEIGKAYGKRTFLVTNWKPVAAGTDGAVSLEGTLAGVLGTLILSCWAWFVGCISFRGLLITTVASLLANYIESVIGAQFQAKVRRELTYHGGA